MTEPSRTLARGDEAELSIALEEDLSKEGPLGVCNDRVHQYQNNCGIWMPVTDRVLEARVADYAGCPVLGGKPSLLKVSHRSARGAVGLLKARLHRQGELDFSKAPPGLTLSDCFINLSSGFAAEAHSPSQLSRFRHEFPYDAHAQAPTFLQALDDFFADAAPADRAQRIAVIQELFGAALAGVATKFQRCLLLYGAGANGKSTLAEMLAAAFPPDSLCSVPPQQFKERFRLELLEGKLLNVVNELPSSEIVGTAGFKSVISGDECTAERKHRDAFRFRPRALHVFLANTLPPFTDRSLGFSRRFVVLPMERDMRAVPGFRPDFSKRVVEAELQGIVNWLIIGAMRGHQTGIGRSQASDTIVGEWSREGDAVAVFIDEACDLDPTAQTQASVLYARFATWAKNNGFRSMKSTTFGKRMRALGLGSIKGTAFNYYAVRSRGGVGGGFVGGP